MSDPVEVEENVGNVDLSIVRDHGEQLLPVKLTEADRLERADLIAKAQEMIEKLEAEKKAVTDRIKADLSHHQGQVSHNAKELRKNSTDKKVPVDTIKNYRNFTVTKKRMDTGEILNERPMTDHERQLGLEFTKENDLLSHGTDSER